MITMAAVFCARTWPQSMTSILRRDLDRDDSRFRLLIITCAPGLDTAILKRLDHSQRSISKFAGTYYADLPAVWRFKAMAMLSAVSGSRPSLGTGLSMFLPTQHFALGHWHLLGDGWGYPESAAADLPARASPTSCGAYAGRGHPCIPVRHDLSGDAALAVHNTILACVCDDRLADLLLSR